MAQSEHDDKLNERKEFHRTELTIEAVQKQEPEQQLQEKQAANGAEPQQQQQRKQQKQSDQQVRATGDGICGRDSCLRNSDNILTILTVLAVLLGSMTGLLLRDANLGSREILLIGFPGVLMMNMLKMMTIPLVASSLVAGVANFNAISSGKMGIITFVYYALTTFSAVILGIILVVTIHPGTHFKRQDAASTSREGEKTRSTETLHTILDLLRNLIPDNLIEVCFKQSATVTKIQNETFKKADNSTGWRISKSFQVTSVDATNVLGLVSVSLFLGIIIRRMGEQAELLARLFSILNDAVMLMVQVIIWYSPIGIFFLITGKILEVENLLATLRSLGLYMATVTSGLVIHASLILTLAYLAITRKNPLLFVRGVFQAWITALGTASSAATLPVTFKCLEENNGIDKTITRFVLPIGATVNMDGTALYEAVACIFIAQVNSVQLDAGQIFVVSLTATLAATGAASVPSAGIVTLVLVLSSVGLPVDDISLILTVDWLLDRLRTSVNVLGDAFGAGIIDHLCEIQSQEQAGAATRDTGNQLSPDSELDRSAEEA